MITKYRIGYCEQNKKKSQKQPEKTRIYGSNGLHNINSKEKSDLSSREKHSETKQKVNNVFQEKSGLCTAAAKALRKLQTEQRQRQPQMYFPDRSWERKRKAFSEKTKLFGDKNKGYHRKSGIRCKNIE